MASLYEFDTASTIRDQKYPKSPATIVKVEKALAKKKIPQSQSDKFVKELKAFNFSPLIARASAYISKNMVAQGLAPVKASPSVLEKAMMVAIFGPQKKILQAKFDLSIHLKGKDLQLQHTDCKGKKKILFIVAP